MNINNYLEKLRAKPEHERRRIAVIATGVAFSVIFLIWLVSFSEMNRSQEAESSSTSVSDQLDEMKSGLKDNRQSIEEMMQGFSGDNSAVGGESLNQEPTGTQSEGTTESQNQNTDNVQDNQQEIPSLP